MMADRNDLTSAKKKIVRIAYLWQCAYCGVFTLNGHVDHIHPISKGGSNDFKNLCYSCASCNLRKSDALKGWEPKRPNVLGRLLGLLLLMDEKL